MISSAVRFLTLSVAVAATLLATASGSQIQASAAERPNILLLVSDDQRPDTIHALGNDRIQTPNLDRLVASGTAFTRATCGNPICTPSRAEILSGTSSFRNGVLDFGRGIKPELPTMSRWFADAGYRTFYVGKWHNDGVPVQRGYSATRGLYRGGGGKFYEPQFDWAGRPVTGYRGWIFQDDAGKLFPELGVGLTPDISSKFADAAVSLIEDSAKSEQPFFLHVNFTSPHDPLLLPPGWEKKYDADSMPLPKNFAARHPFDHGNFDGRDEQLFKWPRTPEEICGELAAYYAVISYMDQQIGRILDTLRTTGQDKNTIIVFTSDHGLSVGSHGLRGKQSMYEHTIGVPLLMSGPGIPTGERRVAQCYLRDLFPTLADLAGLDGPGDRIDGRSLGPVLRGEQSEIHPFVIGYFRNFQRMIRDGDWKYIEYPAVEVRQLFNLADDPHELRNLAEDAKLAGRRKDLAAKLHGWLKDSGDPLYSE